MSRFAFFTQRKAGSQWITDVLSDYRVLACVPHVHFKRVLDAEYELATFIRDEGDGSFAAPIFDVSYALWKALRSGDDRAIYVGRDPRDAVVSYAYSVAYSHVTEPFISLARTPLLMLDERSRIMMAAALLLRNASRLGPWGSVDPSAGCYVTTYERVIENQEREFGAMFEFLGWNIPDDVVRAVVAAHSFAERSGGRARGEADPFSHYRQGTAGDWRNHFDRDLARQFEEAFPRLLLYLGYEDAETWWEAVPETLPGELLEVGELTAKRQGGADSRVRALSTTMTNALRERDERWGRYEKAMNDRCNVLEREVENLRLICDERLVNIAALHAQAQDLGTQLREATEESEDIREALRRSELTCDERLTNIGTLHAQAQELREQLLEAAKESGELREALRRSELTCEERLAALEAQNRALEQLRSEADHLVAICDERMHLIAEQARTIDELRVAQRDVAVGMADVQVDIVDGLSMVLGAGWYPLEFADDLPFRWGRDDATIHVALVRELRHKIVLDIEPGPGVHLAPFTLSVRLDDGALLERVPVRGRERIAFELPHEAPRLFTLVLTADEGGAATAGDDRILDFRVFSVTLEPVRDVFPIWAEPTSGFYAPEHEDDQLFRWVGGDATIALSESRGSTLSFDVESGPGFGSEAFELAVLAADGSEVAHAVVGSRISVDVPIDRDVRFDEITLHADGGGQIVPGDERIMNYRVIAR